MDNRLRYLSALRFFESASRLKSYSKAAEELHVTQAAISQKLRQLEDRLGCKLFVRRGREMHLTDKGQILQKHVNDGFKNIVTGLNRIQNANGIDIRHTETDVLIWLGDNVWIHRELNKSKRAEARFGLS